MNGPQSKETQVSRARPAVGIAAAHEGRTNLMVAIHRVGFPDEIIELSPWRAYTLGRGSDADVLVDVDRVSRLHATLMYYDGWVVSDANSSNGTYLTTAAVVRATPKFDQDSMPLRLDISRHRLGEGDAILLGTSSAWVEVVSFPSATAVAAASEDDVYRSAAGRKFLGDLHAAAKTKRDVFLIGNTGAGKNFAAAAIHTLSGVEGRFISINCAHLPEDETRLRSELFGHKRGAYTGATDSMIGKVYAADGGTLFLDEIEALNPRAQAFLLNVMERTGDLSPLGGSSARAPTIRVISASKVALNRTGLREDLGFRLLDATLVAVPSLADRREDLPGLIRSFLEEDAGGLRRKARLAPDALKLLVEDDYPGEIRQLRARVRAIVQASAERFEGSGAIHIPAEAVVHRIQQERDFSGRSPPHVVQTGEPRQVTAETTTAAPAPPPAGVNPRRLTAAQTRAALLASSGVIEHAARSLGISRRTLMAKMDAFGIERAGKKE